MILINLCSLNKVVPRILLISDHENFSRNLNRVNPYLLDILVIINEGVVLNRIDGQPVPLKLFFFKEIGFSHIDILKGVEN